MSQSIRNLIADNGYAATFQTMGQYRTALLAACGPDDEDSTTKAEYRRMFGAACADLGLINEKLSLDPNDGGAAPILEAIDGLLMEGRFSRAELDVAAERQRQINSEGWDTEHDDEHDGGDLACAAAAYALCAGDVLNPQSQGDGEYITDPPVMWPWSGAWWKPKDARRNLVKAGALILAEIERMDRAAAHQEQEDTQ